MIEHWLLKELQIILEIICTNQLAKKPQGKFIIYYFMHNIWLAELEARTPYSAENSLQIHQDS